MPQLASPARAAGPSRMTPRTKTPSTADIPRSRASAAPTRGGSDPNLEDELVSTVLTDPRTNSSQPMEGGFAQQRAAR